MDIVYIVKPNTNEELRYSLRSLQNLPHDRVYIAGYKPTWVRGVGHIPVTQVPRLKHSNSYRIQCAIANHPALSDDYILFNDDHFVMKPQVEMPVLNWGRVRDVLHVPTLGNSFRASMEYTLSELSKLGIDDPTSYQLHVPLVLNKGQMSGVYEKYEFSPTPGVFTHYVTIAGNLYNWGGETYDRDVKVLNAKDTVNDWMLAQDFLSTSDVSFGYGHIGAYLRHVFPKKSPYEI